MRSAQGAVSARGQLKSTSSIAAECDNKIASRPFRNVLHTDQRGSTIVDERLRQSIRRFVPAAAIDLVRNTRTKGKIAEVSQILERPAEGPSHLSLEMIAELQQRYPRVPSYSYSDDALLQRGEERCREIFSQTAKRQGSSLELAAHDGMVSYCLANSGWSATALDFSDVNADPRSKKAGVTFVSGNAEQVPFEDNTFDLVFSYNAFEHFERPAAVFAEALRVAKPGGHLFFSFGPLYLSSYGLHAMHSVRIPFCQHLFRREDLDTYIRQNGLGRIEYETLNEWTAAQFRSLWQSHGEVASIAHYREIPDVHGTELIQEFPSCFKGKVPAAEDLFVAIIKITLRKK
jgi:ubiquinone/menaquinone biosynthesis C-methylase UbiE